jgi:tetratricopeptide (TPR) repeat protein
MSKFTKLLFQPKKFIDDSLWFKTHILNEKQYDNLFVISHMGQLKQVESLINYEKLENNLLIILYTKKNLNIPQGIDKQKDDTLFDKSILFQLPNYPNNYRLKSLVYMNRNYKELLSIVKPLNLYLLSFENHYSLLAKNAKNKNINLVLVEEGTATYKNPNLSEYTNQQNFLKKITAKLLSVESVFNWFTNFDEVYAAFPELLKQTFSAKNYHRFFVHMGRVEIDENTLKLIEEYKITKNDFIYVNQRYAIDDNDFTNAILTILDTISRYYNAKIFIKMHPKDRDNLKKMFISKIKTSNNIVFIKENEFLIEPAIQAIQPKGVIGLTSTSLVYTPFVSASTKVYSIKPWFMSLIPNNEKNKEGIKIINDHYLILEQFKHVIPLENQEDLKSTKDYDISELNLSLNTYLEDAQKAYKAQKYYKALVNFEWAYPKGIEYMPQEDFIKYLLNVYQVHGLKQVQYAMNRWLAKELTKENNLQNYIDVIKAIIYILENNFEHGNVVYFKKLYEDVIALITKQIDSKKVNINLYEFELSLLNLEYKVLYKLLLLKAKQYFIDFEYSKSLSLLEKLLQNKNSTVEEKKIIYFYQMQCFFILEKNENSYTFKKDDEVLKLFVKAFSFYKNREYEKALEIFLELNLKILQTEKEVWKIELFISNIYRNLGNYQEAKNFLLSFEEYSKDNILLYREIAYLEYQLENYTKSIQYLDKIYIRQIEYMPKKDLHIYLASLYKNNKYELLIKYLEKYYYKNEICHYYYLLTLIQHENYKLFVSLVSQVLIKQLSQEYKENIFWYTIKALREEGKIYQAYQLLKTKNIDVNNIDFLVYAADVFELSNDFEKAYEVWKKVLKNHNNKKPLDSWIRYYHVLEYVKDDLTK